MPAERVLMRDAREIIRLKFSAGVATREIARQEGAELHERPFVDFATTRNAAIEIAQFFTPEQIVG